MRATIMALLLALCITVANAQQCPGRSSWTNQRGSTLYIENITAEGFITGSYINRAAGYHCQNSPYPVIGWVLQGTNTITFAVKWDNATENCASQTAWTGFFGANCQKLSTSWELVKNGTTDPAQILKGEDQFTRGTPLHFNSLK